LDGKPAAGTDKLVAALESVLKRDPDHVGANHLYIHAVEASTHPERAMESAARLPLLAPSCGHLVHMPAHVYARVGDLESAATSNEAAVNADREYFASHSDMKMGPYYMMYYPHNMHFLAYAETECGNYANARKAAAQLCDHVRPMVAHMQMLEAFLTVPYGVEARCHKWDDIMKEPSPDAKATPLPTITWHFARGMASARQGNASAAQSERNAMLDLVHALPPDAGFGEWNSAKDVFAVAVETLDGEIELAQKHYDQAAKFYRDAAELQDKLNYGEPPDWLLNSRELWGDTLLKKGDWSAAEKVFREDLDRHPRGARSLYGLINALQKQGKTYEASLLKPQFDTAWKQADIQLSAEQ
jgi:tetratricopeptide (TPR) repeat protein